MSSASVIPSGNASPVRQSDGLVPWRARTEESLTLTVDFFSDFADVEFGLKQIGLDIRETNFSISHCFCGNDPKRKSS
jgi:hypothetical protein